VGCFAVGSWPDATEPHARVPARTIQPALDAANGLQAQLTPLVRRFNDMEGTSDPLHENSHWFPALYAVPSFVLKILAIATTRLVGISVRIATIFGTG
jgi:hypothetical protein